MLHHRPPHTAPLSTDPRGFTFIELLVVMIIIGILATIAIMQLLHYRERCFNATMQSDLRAVFIASKQFYMDHPSGSVDKTKLETYGYVPSKDVELTIHDGTEEALLISARHPGTPDVYQVDHTGAVSRQ